MASKEVLPKDVVNVLRKLGFFVLNVKGSHFRLGHRDGRRVVVAVHPRPLSLGTLHAILRQAEIMREELDEKL
ncbi:MAG: type II toxin-antitoxin system HicA family toxin [Candidatus Sungbacteria bacterium]|nr:type II toxin-antitoxin system HicA family toxin [Candidatus Sungbacteria bacterium]